MLSSYFRNYDLSIIQKTVGEPLSLGDAHLSEYVEPMDLGQHINYVTYPLGAVRGGAEPGLLNQAQVAALRAMFRSENSPSILLKSNVRAMHNFRVLQASSGFGKRILAISMIWKAVKPPKFDYRAELYGFPADKNQQFRDCSLVLVNKRELPDWLDCANKLHVAYGIIRKPADFARLADGERLMFVVYNKYISSGRTPRVLEGSPMFSRTFISATLIRKLGSTKDAWFPKSQMTWILSRNAEEVMYLPAPLHGLKHLAIRALMTVYVDDQLCPAPIKMGEDALSPRFRHVGPVILLTKSHDLVAYVAEYLAGWASDYALPETKLQFRDYKTMILIRNEYTESELSRLQTFLLRPEARLVVIELDDKRIQLGYRSGLNGRASHPTDPGFLVGYSAAIHSSLLV